MIADSFPGGGCAHCKLKHENAGGHLPPGFPHFTWGRSSVAPTTAALSDTVVRKWAERGSSARPGAYVFPSALNSPGRAEDSRSGHFRYVLPA